MTLACDLDIQYVVKCQGTCTWKFHQARCSGS